MITEEQNREIHSLNINRTKFISSYISGSQLTSQQIHDTFQRLREQGGIEGSFYLQAEGNEDDGYVEIEGYTFFAEANLSDEELLQQLESYRTYKRQRDEDNKRFSEYNRARDLQTLRELKAKYPNEI